MISDNCVFNGQSLDVFFCYFTAKFVFVFDRYSTINVSEVFSKSFLSHWNENIVFPLGMLC